MNVKKFINPIKKILGANVVITKYAPLRHHGSSEILIFYVKNDPRKFLIKSYAERRHVDIEAANLANISGIVQFRKPKYFGRFENYLIEEYLEGVLFQDIFSKLTPQEEHSCYLAAINELVNIHTSGDLVADKRKLRGLFLPRPLRKRIEKAVVRIQGIGFESYRKFAGRIKPEWMRAIARIDLDCLLRDLSISPRSYFLGHGDYKLNNILFMKGGGIAIIDWLGMGKAQPWYDLAYLLVRVRDNSKRFYMEYYLRRMQSKGYLTRVSDSKAIRQFRSGVVFQQMIRVNSNAHRIQLRADTHHISEFREALNGLSRATDIAS